MANYINYNNRNATRSQSLSPKLAEALSFLQDMGVTADVFSGGQPSSGPNRVGSHRHDDGGAADVFFSKGGRRLDWSNPKDLPIFEDIVRRGKGAGITGFGAGPNYMQPGSMHLGFGSPAVWGAGGKGANAPGWLRDAYNGAKGLTLNSAPAGVQALADAGRTPAPTLPPPTEIQDRPVVSPDAASTGDAWAGVRTADVAGSSPYDIMKNDGMKAGLDAMSKAPGVSAGLGLLAGAFGGGSAPQEDQIIPTGALQSADAADAGRVQAAQQLMNTLMMKRSGRSLGTQGLSLMG